MKQIRGIFRLLYFLCFTIALIIRVRWIAATEGVDMRRFLRIRQSWVRRYLLPALGVRLVVRGTPPDIPCILMANHRSYLDPAVICRDVLAFPVSKAEVANWPVIGVGAKLTGVLFVKRDNPGSRKATLHAIGEKVAEGFPVILFPEGTTHAQPRTIPFRPGAFQMAAERGIPVVPVAFDFQDPKNYWLGDDTFLPHFIRCFGERFTNVFVHYGPAIRNNDADILLRETQAWVDDALANLRQEFF